jgi:hypothetical protein
LLTRNEFSQTIEELYRVKSKQGETTYLEILAQYCEDHDIEIDVVPDLLSDSLKDKLWKQAGALHLVEPPPKPSSCVLSFLEEE